MKGQRRETKENKREHETRLPSSECACMNVYIHIFVRVFACASVRHSLMCVFTVVWSGVWGARPCSLKSSVLGATEGTERRGWVAGGGGGGGQAPKKEVTSIFIALDMHMLTTFNMPWQGKVLLRRKEVEGRSEGDGDKYGRKHLWEMPHVCLLPWPRASSPDARLAAQARRRTIMSSFYFAGAEMIEQ